MERICVLGSLPLEIGTDFFSPQRKRRSVLGKKKVDELLTEAWYWKASVRRSSNIQGTRLFIAGRLVKGKSRSCLGHRQPAPPGTRKTQLTIREKTVNVLFLVRSRMESHSRVSANVLNDSTELSACG